VVSEIWKEWQTPSSTGGDGRHRTLRSTRARERRRWAPKRVCHITLPGIQVTVSVLLILAIATFSAPTSDQALLLGTALTSAAAKSSV
jgi:hypothetical protein